MREFFYRLVCSIFLILIWVDFRRVFMSSVFYVHVLLMCTCVYLCVCKPLYLYVYMNVCVFYCVLNRYLRVCLSLCGSSYIWSIVHLRFCIFPYLFLCTFYRSTSAVFTIFGLLQLHVDPTNPQWIWNWTLFLIYRLDYSRPVVLIFSDLLFSILQLLLSHRK